MNWLQFFSLMREIYLKKKPDLKKIQRKGLLAVKIAQVYALRIDFLNEEKCRHLSKLYRQTIRIGEEDAWRILQNKAQKKFFSEIKDIEKKPFASASIGQVHMAKDKTGKKVVVKIVKQDFKKHFERDVRKLRRLLKFIIFFYPKLRKVADPEGILDDIEKNTLAELDLRKEAQGSETLKKIFLDNKKSFKGSKPGFPKIYYESSNKDVLVTSLVEGKTFDELLEEKKLDYKELLDLFYIHGYYMFGIGTFHGDIHPGNLIKSKDKIYFVDTGAIGEVSEKLRKNLFWFFDALSVYDYKKSAKHLNDMAFKKLSGKKYELFEKKFLSLYSDFKGKSVSEVSLTKKMMDTIKLGVNSGMEFEKGMFSIIKSLMYLDGMVIKCKPNAVLLEDMRRFIDDYKAVIGEQ